MRLFLLPVLHELVQGHVCVSADVPPAPEVRLSEPVLERQPAECLDHQLSLTKVRSFMHAGQMTRKSAQSTEYLRKQESHSGQGT